VEEQIQQILEPLRVPHFYCDDSWYSCPKAEDGCANDGAGDDCNCGADKHNALVDDCARRLAALMDGCYGCSARVTSCTQFEVGAPCLRTPTEPKE